MKLQRMNYEGKAHIAACHNRRWFVGFPLTPALTEVRGNRHGEFGFEQPKTVG
jgi:hypothetical protein